MSEARPGGQIIDRLTEHERRNFVAATDFIEANAKESTRLTEWTYQRVVGDFEITLIETDSLYEPTDEREKPLTIRLAQTNDDTQQPAIFQIDLEALQGLPEPTVTHDKPTAALAQIALPHSIAEIAATLLASLSGTEDSIRQTCTQLAHAIAQSCDLDTVDHTKRPATPYDISYLSGGFSGIRQSPGATTFTKELRFRESYTEINARDSMHLTTFDHPTIDRFISVLQLGTTQGPLHGITSVLRTDGTIRMIKNWPEALIKGPIAGTIAADLAAFRPHDFAAPTTGDIAALKQICHQAYLSDPQ